jgi:hypothetical protein
MIPNSNLAKILATNKCKIAYKNHNDNVMYISINYSALLKNKPQQGLEVWGHAQAVFDKIASTVRKYYPLAELSSQDARGNVVYRIVGNDKIKPEPQPEASKAIKRK